MHPAAATSPLHSGQTSPLRRHGQRTGHACSQSGASGMPWSAMWARPRTSREGSRLPNRQPRTSAGCMCWVHVCVRSCSNAFLHALPSHQPAVGMPRHCSLWPHPPPGALPEHGAHCAPPASDGTSSARCWGPWWCPVWSCCMSTAALSWAGTCLTWTRATSCERNARGVRFEWRCA